MGLLIKSASLIVAEDWCQFNTLATVLVKWLNDYLTIRGMKL
jgi:hypothetical protein